MDQDSRYPLLLIAFVLSVFVCSLFAQIVVSLREETTPLFRGHSGTVNLLGIAYRNSDNLLTTLLRLSFVMFFGDPPLVPQGSRPWTASQHHFKIVSPSVQNYRQSVNIATVGGPTCTSVFRLSILHVYVYVYNLSGFWAPWPIFRISFLNFLSKSPCEVSTTRRSGGPFFKNQYR